MYLEGSEDVRKASHNMSSAASDMQRVASSIEESLSRHREWQDEWLDRLEQIMENHTPPQITLDTTAIGKTLPNVPPLPLPKLTGGRK